MLTEVIDIRLDLIAYSARTRHILKIVVKFLIFVVALSIDYSPA